MLIFSPALFDGESNSYSGIGAFQAIQAIPHFIYKSVVGQLEFSLKSWGWAHRQISTPQQRLMPHRQRHCLSV
jgi:hypothetical protein